MNVVSAQNASSFASRPFIDAARQSFLYPAEIAVENPAGETVTTRNPDDAVRDATFARTAATDRRAALCYEPNQREAVQGFHTGWGMPCLGGEDSAHGFDGNLRKQTAQLNWG